MRPDFSREVHCILGLPFDAVNLAEAEQRIRAAAANRTRCFFSTPNLNFLIGCRTDNPFRNSVINSDLSIADGMPLIWIARVLGIPIRERVAGSDLFEKLRAPSSTRLSVYFFGGMEGVAETACRRINADKAGLACVGYEYPGFSSVLEMSSDETIAKINSSGADFLVVSLGAKKGQAWIEHNRARISVPVFSHLGAVVNFAAGSVGRAPIWLRQTGLEWLWRIKEEPKLWQRYATDGWMFLKLLVTRAVPYAWFMVWHKPSVRELNSAAIELFDEGSETIIRLRGAWRQDNLKPLRQCFSSATLVDKDIRIDLEQVSYVDSAFIGLLMLLYGDRVRLGKRLSVINMNKRVRQIFRYACAEFLLGAW